MDVPGRRPRVGCGTLGGSNQIALMVYFHSGTSSSEGYHGGGRMVEDESVYCVFV